MGTIVGGRTGRAASAASRVGGDWRSTLARVGLTAKGAFNVSLGLLAVEVARGRASSDEASPAGAIEQVARQPFGRWLLVVLTIGLACLVVWHVVQALTGDPVEGDEPLERATFAGKALAYAATTAIAATVLIANWGAGGGGTGSGDGEEQATATVLDWPGGRWLVGAAGLAVIAGAAYAVYRHAVQGEFLRRLDRARMGPSLSSAVEAAGRAGYGARGAVFAVIGGLLVVAAARHRPDEAGGLSEALRTLAEQPWGQALLWVVAVGLVLYGCFALAEAAYRRAA